MGGYRKTGLTIMEITVSSSLGYNGNNTTFAPLLGSARCDLHEDETGSPLAE